MLCQASCALCANAPSPGEKNGGTTGMTSVIVRKDARYPTTDEQCYNPLTKYPVADNSSRTLNQLCATSWFQIYFFPISDKKQVSTVLLFA